MRGGRVSRALSEAVQPGLLALCGVIGVLEVGSWLVIAPFLPGASRSAVVGWLLLQRLGLLVVLAALLPGCYATARQDLAPAGAIRAAIDRIGADTPRLLGAMVASRSFVAALTALGLLAALGALGLLDTASVWSDAVLGVGLDRGLLATLGVPAAVLGASWLARGAVGMHDLRAIEAEAPPVRAALWSVRAWRGRARGLPAYAVVRGSLLTVPAAAAVLVLTVWPASGPPLSVPASPAPVGAAAGAFVATTALTRAILVVSHRRTYDRLAAAATTAPADQRDPLLRERRVILATVLVLGTVVGVGAIRTADVQPEPAADVDVDPEAANATITTAIERTRAEDILTEQVTAVRNESTGGWVRTSRRQALLQRSDRSARFYGTLGGVEDRTIYATDGRFGMLRKATPPARPGPLHLWTTRGRWSVLVGQAYGWTIEDAFVLPPPDADWRLRERSEHTLVYRVWDPSTLSGHGIDGLPSVPATARPGGETGARIVLDRDTLTVREASLTVVRENGTATRWERTVTKTGDVQARRPGSIGHPSPPARLWDVVYY